MPASLDTSVKTDARLMGIPVIPDIVCHWLVNCRQVFWKNSYYRSARSIYDSAGTYPGRHLYHNQKKQPVWNSRYRPGHIRRPLL